MKPILRIFCLFALFCVSEQTAKAQGLLAPVACQQFFSASGIPLAGGFLYSYASGTLTPQPTYTDSTISIANSNPMVLNAGGFAVSSTGSCGIWLVPGTAYRFVLQNASASQQWQVDGITAQNGSALLSQPNTWTALQTFSGGIAVTGSATYTGGLTTGTGAPAYQSGTGGPPVPTLLATEEGTSSTGVASRNLNTPEAYISRWDSSTNALCQSGLLDACSAPVQRIDFTNGNTGTTDTPVGLLVNGWGFQGLTPLNGAGGTVIGIGAVLADVVNETGNTDMFGINSNVTVQGNPSGLDRAGFTRAVFSDQVNITNSTGSDCKFLATSGSGNYCGGMSVVSSGANNSSIGLAVASSSATGKGFLTGIDMFGAVNVGIAILKGNSAATGIGFMSAAGGNYGYAVGGTSITPPTNAPESLAVPTVGFVFEPKLQLASGDSIPEMFRVFGGSTSVANEWEVNARNALTSMRWAYGTCSFTIGTNPAPCGSYTDVFAVASNGSAGPSGALCLDWNYTSGANFCFNGSPSAATIITVPNTAGVTTTLAELGAQGISSGSITLSGGNGSHTFTTAYGTAPNCVGSDATAKNAVQITSSTTAITIAGTSSDVVTWICSPTAN